MYPGSSPAEKPGYEATLHQDANLCVSKGIKEAVICPITTASMGFFYPYLTIVYMYMQSRYDWFIDFNFFLLPKVGSGAFPTKLKKMLNRD